MGRVIAVFAVLVLALAAIALTPTTIGADARRAAAGTLVRAGFFSGGVTLLRPLAAAGDPVALNNLGVLVNDGLGTAEDPAEAARLINAAAAAGSKRAAMNLALIRTPCNTQHREEGLRQLLELTRAGDRRAASFLADCLKWGPDLSGEQVAEMMLEAGAVATAGGDVYEELKFGFLLLDQLRAVSGGKANSHRQLLGKIASAAATYFTHAAAQGQGAGYEGLSILAGKYAAVLDEPTAAKVGERTKEAWLEAAARAGQPRSQCAYGGILAKEIAGAPPDAAKVEFLRSLFFECATHGNSPRKVVVRDGRAGPLAYDPVFDVWMRDDAFLVMTPRYEDFDYDEANQGTGLMEMQRVLNELRTAGVKS